MPPRLLYIDDDADLCRLVRRDLERGGYVVEVAASGPAGLERLRAAAFDAVALDHHMPGQSGLETLEAIGTLVDPPPVVYVTGELEGRVAVAALKAGAADYVIKQADGQFMPLLRAAIAAAVEKRQIQRAREEAERELRASRDRFAALAEERRLLIQEINHRIANSLQLVNAFLVMQSASVSNAEAKAVLASAIGRVDAIAQVHRQLYIGDSVHAVDLGPYLEHLVAELSQVAESGLGGARVALETEAIRTTTDRALAIGIMVTELVINALKHAFPNGAQGSVRVACRPSEDGGIRLVVEDDGQGTPPDAASRRSGLGQKIIRLMAEKLGAALRHDPSPRGTRIVVDIPAADRRPASPA